MNHAGFIQTPDILDEIDQTVYIADMDTCELLFVNRTGRNILGLSSDYRGKKCYEVLQGRDSVCPFCKNNCLKENGETCTWDHFNEKLGTYFQLQDRQIRFEGRRARIEIAIDISERECRQRELKNALAEQHLLADCVKTLNGNGAIDERINQILEDIGTYYHADRSYVFSLSSGGQKLNNTNEWCTEKVSPQISILQNVDIHYMDRWSPVFLRKEAVVESDIEHIRNSYSDEYEIMIKQGIHSYMEAPLFFNGKLSGFIGVDNPDAKMIGNSSSTILALAYSASNALMRDAERIKEQTRYERALHDMVLVVPNAVGVLRFNLSKNNYFAEIHGDTFFGITEKTHKWDTLAEKMLEHVPDKDDRAAFKMFYSKSLLEVFHEGTARYERKYHYIGCDSKQHTVFSCVQMIQNPETNDIEGIAYSLDLSKQVLYDQIFQIITSRSFDLVALIHLDTGLFEAVFLGESLPNEYKHFLSTRGAVCSFQKFCEESMRHMDEETKKDYESRLSPEYMKNELEKNGGSYEFTLKEKFASSRNEYSYRKFLHYRIDGDENTVLVIESDETEIQLKMRQQLELEKQLRHKADLANAAKSDFLSRMSHDMRTPLNGVIGMAYLAQEQKNPPYTADCLAKINTSAKFLLELINNILDLSKVESGKIEFHPEPYPAQEFNEYIDAVIRPLCKEKNLKFVLTEIIDITSVPLVDKNSINQVLFNLLSNAVKFTPENGTITYTITGKQIAENHVSIQHQIADTGIGMSREFQEHLFEPFSQEGRNDISEQRGSGLGLSIVKKLVDLMGGRIAVQSKIGHGTTFTLDFGFDTVSVSAEEHTVSAKESNVSDGTVLVGKHVLLCEDHPLNQEIAKSILNEKGMIVDIAENGAAGIKRFSVSSVNYYDVVLMDIRMPVMDGYEAAKKLRSLDRPDAKAVPIIAMTADAFDDSVREARNVGMNGYVTKPIEPKKLFAELSRILKLSQE